MTDIPSVPAEVTAEIVTLLRAGCEIHLTPQISPLGVIYADLKVTPPPSAEPRTLQDEAQALVSGAVPTAPYRSSLDLYGDQQGLSRILRAALLLFAPRRSR